MHNLLLTICKKSQNITNRKPKSNITNTVVESFASDSRLDSGVKVIGIHCNYCSHSHQVQTYSTLSHTCYDY